MSVSSEQSRRTLYLRTLSFFSPAHHILIIHSTTVQATQDGKLFRQYRLINCVKMGQGLKVGAAVVDM